MNCSIVTIGTELLIGQVIDTNSAYLGMHLNDNGIDIVSRISVSDKREDMLKAFKRATEDADLVIITGGLGPTKDDITKSVLAEFLNKEMYFDEDQYVRIQGFFKKLNRSTTEAHKNQCFFPVDTLFLENNMGTAQGMLFNYNGKRIISMPGVPYEMKHIVENHLLPLLKSEQKDFILHRTIKTAGVGESILASKIEDIEDSLPPNFSIAYLPSLSKVRVRISGKSSDLPSLNKSILSYANQIAERLDSAVFGYDDEELEDKVGQLLIAKNWKLGLAESCTGGSIARKITSVSGSSAYFEGGVVSYSNHLKHKLLDVSLETLQKYGAVSEEVVKEMVQGTLKNLHVDLALSVSGIAGPSGGTPEKPVGTIWFAVGTSERIITKKIKVGKDRSKNIDYSVNTGLNLLRLFLEDKIESI